MADIGTALRAALAPKAAQQDDIVVDDAATHTWVPAHVRFLHQTSIQQIAQRSHLQALVQSALVLHGMTPKDAFPDRRLRRKLHDICVPHTIDIHALQTAWASTTHAAARVQLLACPTARFNTAVHIALYTRALHTPHGALLGFRQAGVQRRDVLDAMVCPQDVCRLACIADPRVLNTTKELDRERVLPAARTATGERVRDALKASLPHHQQRGHAAVGQQDDTPAISHKSVHAVQACIHTDAPTASSALGKVHASLREMGCGVPVVSVPLPTSATVHTAAAQSDDAVPTKACMEAFHLAQPAALHATRSRAEASKRARSTACKCGEALLDAGVRPHPHDVVALLGLSVACSA